MPPPQARWPVLAKAMEWRTAAILAATHIATRLLGQSLTGGIDGGNAGYAVRLQRRPVDVPGTGADEAVTLLA